MTHKERMLATLRGDPTDRLPWAPRLDLWYDANRRADTLAAPYQRATLRGITDDLDFGYHAIVPRFKDLRDPMDDVHRALGIYNLWTMPCTTRFHNVEVTVTRNGGKTRTSYRTPVGNVTTTVLYNEAMRRDGKTVTLLAVDGKAAAAMCVHDPIKKTTPEAIEPERKSHITP